MPNESVGEIIFIEEYIAMIKNGVIGPDGKRLSKGVGHLLYEMTRRLSVVIKNHSEVLSQEQIELIESIRYSLKLISDELFSNPHFDGNSLFISISNASSLDSGKLLSGVTLGEGDDTISFDSLLSRESLKSLDDALSIATRYAGKSSKSQPLNSSNLSKSSMTISESISENGNAIKSWKDIGGKYQ